MRSSLKRLNFIKDTGSTSSPPLTISTTRTTLVSLSSNGKSSIQPSYNIFASLIERDRVTNLFIPFLCIDPIKDAQPGAMDAEELIEVHRVPLQHAVELILVSRLSRQLVLLWLIRPHSEVR